MPQSPRKPTVGRGTAPRGVDPAVWALVEALAVAKARLPYASAEARLLDGVWRWLVLASRGFDATTEPQPRAGHPSRALVAHGPQWSAVLALVTATARLVSPEAQTLLAPWTAGVAGGAPRGGSPAAGAVADFLAGVAS